VRGKKGLVVVEIDWKAVPQANGTWCPRRWMQAGTPPRFPHKQMHSTDDDSLYYKLLIVLAFLSA